MNAALCKAFLAFHLYWRWTRYCFGCDRIYFLRRRAHRHHHGCVYVVVPS